MVADVLVPNRHQAIHNHHADSTMPILTNESCCMITIEHYNVQERSGSSDNPSVSSLLADLSSLYYWPLWRVWVTHPPWYWGSVACVEYVGTAAWPETQCIADMALGPLSVGYSRLVWHLDCHQPAIREYVNGLVQDCSDSSVLAMELLQSCTKSSANGLLPEGTKPLPEPMLTYHQCFGGHSPETSFREIAQDIIF